MTKEINLAFEMLKERIGSKKAVPFDEFIEFALNPPPVPDQGTIPITGIEEMAEVDLPPPVGSGDGINASLFANNINVGTQFNLLPNTVK